MHPHLKSILVSKGLSAGASDDDAKKFYGGLSDKDKAMCNARLAQLMGGEADGDDAGLSATPGSPDLNQPRTTTKAPPPIGEGIPTPPVETAPNNAVPSGATLSAISHSIRQPDPEDQHVAQLQRRVKTIKAMGETLEIPKEEMPTYLGDARPFEDIRAAMLASVASRAKAHQAPSNVAVNQSEAEKISEALPYAMLERSSMFHEHKDTFYKTLDIKRPDGVEQLRNRKATDMMKLYFSALGIKDSWSISDRQLEDSMGPRGMRRLGGARTAALAESVSDFGSITLDAMNKSLRFLYLDAPKTWPIWAQRVTNNDFKNINRVVLSEVPNMVSRLAGGELQYVQMQDSKEVYALVEYAEGVRFTRRLIINDDMDALANVPRLHANAASRLEEDTAYAPLTANSTMADTYAIFDNTHHANDVTSGGPPTSVSNISTTALKIETQTGLAGKAVLDLEPKFLLVPTALKWAAIQFVQSEKLTAALTTPLGDGNPFFKSLTVVSNVRLNTNSTAKWYLMADYRAGQVPTIEVCFLKDEPEPVIRQMTDFDTEDVKMLCRHTVAAKCIDYRGIARNAGA